MNRPKARNERPSLHHTAASYAFHTVVYSFLVNIIGQAVAANVAKSFISTLTGLVMLSAIPAGIIGSCGIPKYGAKKLLSRSLIGGIIPLIAMYCIFWIWRVYGPAFAKGAGD